MKTLSIKIPDKLFSDLTETARLRNVPRSEIARERLATPPSTKLSLWSRMEDLVFDSDILPTDLSSNKNHLEGYGEDGSH